jgi:glutamyl-tRNA reductase
VLALRARADEIRRAELAEALAKLRHLSNADRAMVEALSRAIVNKLLHEPTVRLKESARQGGEATEAVRRLFGLDEESPGK